MKIYWVSRYEPLPAQINELKRLFGADVELVIDPSSFDDAVDILERYKASGADELMVVAPLMVIQRLTDLGIKPLCSEMQSISRFTDPNTDVAANGRFYRFIGFKRFQELRMIRTELEPLTEEERSRTMKIHWMSRHEPLPAQIAALKQHFGDDVELVVDPAPFTDENDILERYKASGADELMIVAPVTVIQRLINLGIKPLCADMQHITRFMDPSCDVIANGRFYRFVRFRRIEEVRLIKSDLGFPEKRSGEGVS